MKIIVSEKCCTLCGLFKPIEEFAMRTDRKNNSRRSHCNECMRESARSYYKAHPENQKARAKSWREENKEKRRIYSRKRYVKHTKEERERITEWHHKNPERSHVYSVNRRAYKEKVSGRITKTEWEYLLDFYGHKCLCCGRNDVKLTMDHVIPLSMGGPNLIENIQPLCSHCNKSKGMRYIDYRIA